MTSQTLVLVTLTVLTIPDYMYLDTIPDDNAEPKQFNEGFTIQWRACVPTSTDSRW